MDPLAPLPVDPERDLVLDRIVPVDAARIWAAWTTPDLLMQWFTPAPWRTIACEIDLRPGGIFRTVMQGPEGPPTAGDPGCFLEVIPQRRLVWTDALGPGFRPRPEPFMTAAITLEPVTGGTRYLAHAMHRDRDIRQQHQDMGFAEGWGAALDQLVALCQRRERAP